MSYNFFFHIGDNNKFASENILIDGTLEVIRCILNKYIKCWTKNRWISTEKQMKIAHKIMFRCVFPNGLPSKTITTDCINQPEWKREGFSAKCLMFTYNGIMHTYARHEQYTCVYICIAMQSWTDLKFRVYRICVRILIVILVRWIWDIYCERCAIVCAERGHLFVFEFELGWNVWQRETTVFMLSTQCTAITCKSAVHSEGGKTLHHVCCNKGHAYGFKHNWCCSYVLWMSLNCAITWNVQNILLHVVVFLGCQWNVLSFHQIPNENYFRSTFRYLLFLC